MVKEQTRSVENAVPQGVRVRISPRPPFMVMIIVKNNDVEVKNNNVYFKKTYLGLVLGDCPKDVLFQSRRKFLTPKKKSV